mmetsp:Transcript_36645/g.105455  ORF Transcript_36645/g.105455 Transcript_36645/m.105455 type:complete len:97 (-) Transcript_36645:180-470(-)
MCRERQQWRWQGVRRADVEEGRVERAVVAVFGGARGRRKPACHGRRVPAPEIESHGHLLLLAMGFMDVEAKFSLEAASGDATLAMNMLLENATSVS